MAVNLRLSFLGPSICHKYGALLPLPNCVWPAHVEKGVIGGPGAASCHRFPYSNMGVYRRSCRLLVESAERKVRYLVLLLSSIISAALTIAY